MPRTPLTGMAQVTALTRAGKLDEATALLQRHLRGQIDNITRPAPESPPLSVPGSEVIEGVFTVLDTPPRRASAQGARAQKAPASAAPVAKTRESLARTLRRIARGGMPDADGRMAPDAPPDDRFTLHRHTGAAGSRDYMLFLPHPLPAAPCPVVVMLHGCTQSPQDFAIGTGMNALAQAQGVIVVYPAQAAGANINKCWNWFRPGDQQRDKGEPAILAAITREVLARQNADPSRVYVAGLSAGGAAAVILAQAYPDLFAAVGVHSGLAMGAAQDVGSAFGAMNAGAAGHSVVHRVPTIVFHGTADTTVNIANAHAVARQAQRGIPGTHGSTTALTPRGRSYTRQSLTAPDGRSMGEVWLIDGAGHAWAGGSARGSFTDPAGPDASAEMLRFFAQHHCA